VESAHEGFKSAVEQRLRLRGSCEFESLEAYWAFLETLLAERNAARAKRVAEELAVMRPLPSNSLPPSAWRRVTLDVPTRKYRTPRVWEKTVQLLGHPFRQIYVLDLGHADPTVLLTNEQRSPAKLLTRYAQRMLIENAISDAVRFFHMDALSSAVGLKVDFDMALLVIASGLYRRLAHRMRGYADSQARQIFRDLVDMPADVHITEHEIEVRFHRGAHLPIVLTSGLLNQPVAVPCWNGISLRLTA
jgi:hypothetical protein